MSSNVRIERPSHWTNALPLSLTQASFPVGTSSLTPKTYPFLELRARVNEDFAARVVARLGGTRFDGSRNFPAGIKPVDFRVENYLLEHKGLEQDPLEVEDRHAKTAAFVREKAKAGLIPLSPGTEPNTVVAHLTGEVSQEYWRRFLGVSVGRQMEKAAEQIRSSRVFLGEPYLPGAVFIVNESAPFIDPQSFRGLVAAQRARFADAIDLAIFFSCIPGQVATSGPPRLAVIHGYFPQGSAHDAFGERFLAAFEQELLAVLGRERLEPLPEDATLSPARAPVRVELPEGGFIRYH
ncbi:MAG TPA: hypothetical protein VGL42_03645 [Opitutaceae bacterium]